MLQKYTKLNEEFEEYKMKLMQEQMTKEKEKILKKQSKMPRKKHWNTQ